MNFCVYNTFLANCLHIINNSIKLTGQNPLNQVQLNYIGLLPTLYTISLDKLSTVLDHCLWDIIQRFTLQ